MKDIDINKSGPIKVNTDQLPDFLTIAQVSAICGLGVGSIRNYCRQGKFPQPIKFTPKKLFWRKSDILKHFPFLQD